MTTLHGFINLTGTKLAELRSPRDEEENVDVTVYPTRATADAALKQGETTCAVQIPLDDGSYFKVIYQDPEFGWDKERFLDYGDAFRFAVAQNVQDLAWDIKVMSPQSKPVHAIGPGGVHVRAGEVTSYFPRPVSARMTVGEAL